MVDGRPGSQRALDPSDRVILHVDMDAFFASVEVLDDPSLRGRPVIVGGSGVRGVVAACTYEARMFGVRSAMPSSVARRLCPDAVFVDGRFHRYVEESRKLHAVFQMVTPLVEGISLDEAFLDVTGARHLLGAGPAIASLIRDRVQAELRLSCSVGVARSKLMAKLASKAAKPQAGPFGIRPGAGVVVVAAEDELSFLHPLPARALWGVGPVTGRKLDGLGVATVGDLASLPDRVLDQWFGRAQAAHLAALARGEDLRPVEPVREAKSVGHEETFSTDLWDRDRLYDHLIRMVDASSTTLRSSGLVARTVNVKVRFADFTMTTRSHTLGTPIDTSQAVAAVAVALFDTVDVQSGVRLLGVSLSGFGHSDQAVQLSMDLGAVGSTPPGEDSGTRSAEPAAVPRAHLDRADDEAERIQESWTSVTAAVDAIRIRYGGSSVGPASLVGSHGLRVRRRGEAQWGPSAQDPSSMDDERPRTL